MIDVSNEYDKSTEKGIEDSQQLNAGVAVNRNEGKATEIKLPTNRVIRKRLAARTIAIHRSALPPELQEQVFKDTNETSDNDYLTKKELPDKIHLTVPSGERKLLSRDEAWEFADEAGSQLEWHMLPDTMSGKASALFSTTGQGVYANYGRPSMDFSGFFFDYVRASRRASVGVVASQESILLGPIFITVDAISAAGFTTLGHLTRGAPLTNKTVLKDIVSTGIYEGSASWTSARLGVFTGARAIRLAAILPIPGARLAAIPVGFLVGAVTAIFAKRFANQYKDIAIDASYRSGKHSRTSDVDLGKVIPA